MSAHPVLDRFDRRLRVVRPDPAEQRIARIVRHPEPGQPIDDSPESANQVELNLLGGFRLLEAGELVQVSLTGQRLLALLACRSGSLVRSQIAHILWPDTINARAAASLRTTLYRMERTCPGLVVATRTHLRLAAGMRVDLEQSTKLATRILAADLPANAELLEDALRANLYDDLLPNWDEDWLTEHQSRFHQLRLESLEALSARLTAAGHHGAAVLAAQAAVHADSLRDSAHESLIRACVVQGNRHDALVHFAAYKSVGRSPGHDRWWLSSWSVFAGLPGSRVARSVARRSRSTACPR